MGYFGPNDDGYQPTRHDIYVYTDDVNDGYPYDHCCPDPDPVTGCLDQEGWGTCYTPYKVNDGYNQNNMFVQEGYNFSCINYKDRIGGIGRNQMYHHDTFGPQFGIGDREGPDERWTANDGSVGTVDSSYPFNSPRMVLISDRWAIGIEHFNTGGMGLCAKHAGETDEQYNKLRFMSPDGTVHERSVDVVRLQVCDTTGYNSSDDAPWRRFRCNTSGRCINRGYGLGEDVCNFPTGELDLKNPDPIIRSAARTSGELSLIRVKGEPFPVGDGPDQLTPAVIPHPDSSFWKKWFADDGDDSPYDETLRDSNLSFIRTHQMMRAGVDYATFTDTEKKYPPPTHPDEAPGISVSECRESEYFDASDCPPNWDAGPCLEYVGDTQVCAEGGENPNYDIHYTCVKKTYIPMRINGELNLNTYLGIGGPKKYTGDNMSNFVWKGSDELTNVSNIQRFWSKGKTRYLDWEPEHSDDGTENGGNPHDHSNPIITTQNIYHPQDAWPSDYKGPADTLSRAGFRSGDSSSPYFYPLTKTNGQKRLMLIAQLSGWYGWGQGILSATKKIIEEYTAQHNANQGEFYGPLDGDDNPTAIADALPDFIRGDDVDLTPIRRPEYVDGYRVYRSETSATEGFVDISDQLGPGHFVAGNAFMDLEVESGKTYWYYVAGINRYDDNTTNEILGSGSSVIEITVPLDTVPAELTSEDHPDVPAEGWSSVNHEHLEIYPWEGSEADNSGGTQPMSYTDRWTTIPGIDDIRNFSYETRPNPVGPGYYEIPVNPLWFNLLDGYRLGNNETTIPFFGFENPFKSPMQPTHDFPLFYKIEGGQIGNAGLRADGVPMPKNPTSYPYVLGYRYTPSGILGDTDQSNYKLSIGSENTNELNLIQYKNSIHTLWLSKYFSANSSSQVASATPDPTLEPYYHSKVYLNNTPNLKKLVMNPARYGNAREEFGEDWSYCESPVANKPESYLGFYIGEYLSDDILNVKNSLETLIAKDSKNDSGCQSLEYFNVSPEMTTLKHLDLSNNDLYVFDFSTPTMLEELFLNKNNIGKTRGGSWVNDTGFPNQQTSLDILNTSRSIGNFLHLKTVDVSNNDILDFGAISRRYTNIENLNASHNSKLGRHSIIDMDCPLLKYLNMSYTSLQSGLSLKDATELKSIILENTNIPKLAVASDTDLDTFKNLESITIGSPNPFFKVLNLRYGNQPNSNEEWSELEVSGYDHEYGYSAFNLKSLDVSQCRNLEKLFLPRGDDSFADGEKTYLEVVNISNTKLGRNTSLNDFMFGGPEFRPEFYPEGHVMEILAFNVKDLANNPCTLSMSDYIGLMAEWNEQGKTLIVYTDEIS